jgi:RimJ/RimL family protein N-acetyltransferase
MIFETARLIARRFGPSDLQPFVTMRNDPDVARYQSWEGYSEEDGHRLLDDLAGRQPGEPGWFQFALEEKKSGAFIGDCGLNVWDEDPRFGRIGYTIASAYWNCGLATEAVAALAAYAFESFPLHRLVASVDPRNAASCRVLEKAGFIREGYFRQSEWFKGAWADDAVYARLRGDANADLL